MLHIKANTATEQLRKLSVFLKGDFKENHGAAQMILDNENGKGYVNSFDIVPGLLVRTYNIEFYKEVRFQKDEESANPIYFLYNLEGYYYHKFSDEESPQKIGEKRNVILCSSSKIDNEVILPPNVPLKLSVIFLMPNQLSFDEKNHKRLLENSIVDISSILDDTKPFRYLGNIDLKIADSASILIENRRTDLVGKLYTKGAAVNTLAAQIDEHDRSESSETFNRPLTEDEFNKVVKLGDYVIDNLGENLKVSQIALHFGLSAKKLQTGCRFLYSKSVSQYIIHLKLEYAKDMILHTDLSISEICYAIGLNNRSHFSKIFKERFKVMPREFKDSYNQKTVMYEISYRSLAKDGFTDTDLAELLEQSRVNNKENHITGCLVYYKDVFFQLIEGPKVEILKLFENIRMDSRHNHIEVLSQGPKVDRLFGGWDMASATKTGDLAVLTKEEEIELNLDTLCGELKEPSVASDRLWRHIVNIIKVGKR